MSKEVTLEGIKSFVNKVNESQQMMERLLELEKKIYLFSFTSEYHKLREKMNKDAETLGIYAIRQVGQRMVVTLTTQVFESLNLEITNNKRSNVFLCCESDIGDMVLSMYKLLLDIKGM